MALSDEDIREAHLLLGRAIRQQRNLLDITLSELSERTGVTLAHLSDIERATRAPSLEALLQIAAGLEILLADLLANVWPFGTTTRPRRVERVPDGRRNL